MAMPAKLAITCGDPAGVGPEIIASWLAAPPADVADVAVIGAPDPDMGERVVAVVQPHEIGEAGPALAEELLAWLAEQLRTFVDLNPDFETPVERLATWLARAGTSFDTDPVPGGGVQMPILQFLGEGLGHLDFTPVPGTETACDKTPMPMMMGPPRPGYVAPSCVPSAAMVDPNRVYGWVEGGGNGASPLDAGKADLWLKSQAFAPTRSNIRPATVTLKQAGRVTIDASDMIASNWYPSERWDFDAGFVGRYKVLTLTAAEAMQPVQVTDADVAPELDDPSTGGGAVLRQANRVRLHERGRVVYLRSSPEELFRRLRHDTHRPLLQVQDPLARLRALFHARDPLYQSVAHFVIETGRPSVQNLVNMLLMQLELAGVLPMAVNNPRSIAAFRAAVFWKALIVSKKR